MIERRTWAKGAVMLGLLVAAGAFLAYRFDLGFQMRRAVAYFRDAGAWPFFIAMAVLPGVGFPQSAFNVMAGSVFAPTMGVSNAIACGATAIAVHTTGCYWLAARGFRPLAERLVRRLGYKVPTAPVGSAWEITLLARVVPGPPVFLQSYLLGLAQVPFGTYLLVSMAVQTAFLAATILAGDALIRGDWWALLLAGVVFAFVGFVIHRLRRRFATAGAR